MICFCDCARKISADGRSIEDQLMRAMTEPISDECACAKSSCGTVDCSDTPRES